MKRFKSAAILLSMLFIALTVLTVGPTPAQACSCAAPPTVAESLERKSAIFAGEVTNIAFSPQWLVRSSADPVNISFEVKEAWKGNLAEHTIVQTAGSSASCGYEGFEVGREYLVFAHLNGNGQLETGICEGTGLLSAASAELGELGQGYIPVPGEDGPQATSSLRLLIWGISGVVVLAVIVFLYRWKGSKR
ncbi:hypothetical protein JCM10914A_12810 [Paenibacillus sp. JCM 10914]|uniref:hypothetical protein n=1 Tax=Paenibacillus sp. JCM 10914 TaxID=1236974 RepID=UPI0003CCAC57|nr:hypothetical protein [Paenibacillus sp. JCM 10914]GAE09051.1 CbiN domain protein [Paenibacillus sp. JCM 10914]